VKCSYYFGAKRRGLLKVEIVLAPKGTIQNFIKNIRYDNYDSKKFYSRDLYVEREEQKRWIVKKWSRTIS